MDGLFTVFGLGTAFGVFCSWMYDVIRRRNLPVSRGASFEAFHGSDVLPAPEPGATVYSGPSEPVFYPEIDSAAPVKPVASIAPTSAATAVVASKTSSVAAVVAAAPSVNAPSVDMQGAAVSSPKTTVVLKTSRPPKFDTPAKLVVDAKNTSTVSKPAESKTPVAAEDVVFTQADVGSTDDTDLNFDVSNVSFVDTVSFGPADVSLSAEPRAPRVVLLLNNTVVRDVQEKDLLELLLVYGILADSEEAGIFQRGDAVTVGRNTVQLVQA